MWQIAAIAAASSIYNNYKSGKAEQAYTKEQAIAVAKQRAELRRRRKKNVDRGMEEIDKFAGRQMTALAATGGDFSTGDYALLNESVEVGLEQITDMWDEIEYEIQLGKIEEKSLRAKAKNIGRASKLSAMAEGISSATSITRNYGTERVR